MLRSALKFCGFIHLNHMSVISKFYHALHIHTEVQEQSDSDEFDAAGREQLSMSTPILPHRRLYLFWEYFDNYPDCI